MLPSSADHPVIGTQQMLSYGHAVAAAPSEGNGMMPDFSAGLNDPRVSRFVGGLVAGAALTIFALKLGGFRFSFGTSVGAG